ncbi:MAG: hypothetical protein WCF16_04000 [Alphaproteobacteria bacterium]
MRVYLGFDDTDVLDAEMGTGKLVRLLEDKLPQGASLWGVVRHQLLFDRRIPFTSHNSSACAVVDAPESLDLSGLIAIAAAHVEEFACDGSDPGLCVARADRNLAPLVRFGRACTHSIMTQDEAREAAAAVHLSGHGGTRDGIIGAAAAVGLTAFGWCGRFIEFRGEFSGELGRLRDFPDLVSVSDLDRSGIGVVSVDRDATVPAPGDLVDTGGWLRPRLWAGAPVLPVTSDGAGLWRTVGRKERSEKPDGGKHKEPKRPLVPAGT